MNIKILDIILGLSLLLKKVKHHKYVFPKSINTITVRLLLCSDHYWRSKKRTFVQYCDIIYNDVYSSYQLTFTNVTIDFSEAKSFLMNTTISP